MIDTSITDMRDVFKRLKSHALAFSLCFILPFTHHITRFVFMSALIIIMFNFDKVLWTENKNLYIFYSSDMSEASFWICVYHERSVSNAWKAWRLVKELLQLRSFITRMYLTIFAQSTIIHYRIKCLVITIFTRFVFYRWTEVLTS